MGRPLTRWLWWLPLLLLLTGSAGAAYDPAANIQAFGARCDGTTDDGAKINAAIAANAVTWGPDSKTCFSSVTITIPWGKTLRGDNASNHPLNSPPGGFTIKCALGVTPCVRVFGALVNVGVDRAAGTAPAGATGVALNQDPGVNGGMVVVDTVVSNNSPVGFSLGVAATGVPAGGFGAFLKHINTCKISDTHLLIASWAEARVSMGRFGCYYDVPGNNYIKVTGPGWANTLSVVNSQFNNGPSSLVQCFIRFDGPYSGGTPDGWSFDTIHVENHNKGFCSNSSTPTINQIMISNSDFWGGYGDYGSEFFAVDPLTTLDRMYITNSEFKKHGSYVLTPAAAFDDVTISNSRFITNTGEVDPSTAYGFTVIAKPGSRLTMTGVRLNKLSLQGDFGGTGGAQISGVIPVEIDMRATGPVSIDVPGQNTIRATCTTGLTFGGTATGLTYANRSCYWQRHGDQVTFSFYIQLSAKGGSTGSALVTGLPYAASAGTGVGNASLYAANMTGLSGLLTASTGAGATYLNIYQGSATGIAPIGDASFLNNSVLQGTIVYSVDAGH